MITRRMINTFGISMKVWELSCQSPFSWTFSDSRLHLSSKWKYTFWFTCGGYLTTYTLATAARAGSNIWIDNVNLKAFAIDVLYILMMATFISLTLVIIRDRSVNIQTVNGLFNLDNQLKRKSNFTTI